jgi:hypothetical protein
LGLWRVGSGAHEGVFQQKAPFVAGVSVPESLGHLLSRLGRLAPKASVARGIAWWWGSPPVALACGKVALGSRAQICCGWSLSEREWGMDGDWGAESQDAVLVDAAPYEATFFAACAAYIGTCHDATRARLQ